MPMDMLQEQCMQRRLGVHCSRFPGASERAAGAVHAEKTRGTPQQVSGC